MIIPATPIPIHSLLSTSKELVVGKTAGNVEIGWRPQSFRLDAKEIVDSMLVV